VNTKENKKFWEEFTAYLSFTVTVASYMASRKKTLACMRNEDNKTI
jgi:hypothetical protein